MTLRTRIITALYMVVIMLVLIVCRGPVIFVALILVTTACQYELMNAFREKGILPYRVPVYASSVLCCGAVFFFGMGAGFAALLICVFAMICAGMFSKEYGMDKTIYSIFVTLYPALCTMCMIALEGEAFTLLLCGLCAAIGSDTFGFFVGKALGKRKLCPRISPKKTVEGAIGSLIGGPVTLLLGSWVFGLFNIDKTFIILGMTLNWVIKDIMMTWQMIAFCGVFGAMTAIVGDLFASSIKRYCGIKDYSTFLPGHGGVLDRVDGVLFSCAAMYLVHFIINLV